MWKTIPDFDKFEISYGGAIRNKKTLKEKNATKRKDGRLVVSLYQNGRQDTKYVKLLIEKLFPQYVPPDDVRLLINKALEKGLMTEEDIEELFDIKM